MVAVTARQFNRAVGVEITTAEGPAIRVNPDRILALGRQQLRVQFQVEKSLSGEPNRARISIYGLSPQRRRQIVGVVKRPGTFTDAFSLDPLGVPSVLAGEAEAAHVLNGVPYVRLLAGYHGKPAGIFEGTGMRVSTVRSRTEQILTLESEDGGLARSAPISKTYPANTFALTIVSDCVRAAGWVAGQQLSLANATLPPKLLASKMARGYLVAGQAVEVLTQVLDGLRVAWWVDDGEFWVLGEGQVLPGKPVILDATGVGVSDARVLHVERIEGDALQATCLLCPSLRVGNAATLVHPEFSGAYRTDRVVHTGDNRGGAFVSQATLRDVATSEPWE